MFRQEKISSSVNEIVYQVKYRGREVIGNSRAGLQLDNRTWELALARKINQVKCWMDNLEVDSVIYQPAVNKSWHPLYGERSTVREAYNEATMYLSKKDGSNYRLNIEVRAYDEVPEYLLRSHPPGDGFTPQRHRRIINSKILSIIIREASAVATNRRTPLF